MIGFSNPLSLDAMSKTLSIKACVKLNENKLGRRKGIFVYECLNSVDKINYRELLPKETFCSKLKQQ